MDHRYRIDTEIGLAVVRFSPAVRGSDVISMLNAVLGDPEWKPGFSRLWDGRDVKHLDVQPHEIEEHSAFLDSMRTIAGKGKSAIVAFRDIDHLTAQLYRERVRRLLGVDIRVFTEMPEAADFLSVPIDSCSI
jgi:hypothetical protein